MLATAYNSWVGSLKLKSLLGSLAKFLICGAVMAAVLMLHGQLAAVLGARFLMRALTLAIMVGAGVIVYLGMAHLLKIPEYSETVATFGGKIKRKLGRKRA